MKATNLEQSKTLLELGVDPGTADMCFNTFLGRIYPWKASVPDDIPIWSLTALLDLIPKDSVYMFTLVYGGWNDDGHYLMDDWFAVLSAPYAKFVENAKDVITAVYNLVVKLKSIKII